MNCTAIRKKLSAFGDREVSSALRSEMEAHLAACSGCRQVLADLDRLWLALEDAPSPPMSPDFSQEIMRKIATKQGSRLSHWTRALDQMFPAPVAMAAMVLLGLLIGGLIGRAALEERVTIATVQGQAATLEALDAFAPTPKGSLAQGYFLLVSDTTQVKR